jgi:mannose-6-phosphate isomerase-like protein (cupin superfamily)
MSFVTRTISTAADVIAPDGSEVRVLCRTGQGSMAQFTLPPPAVSKATAHHNIEEIWYFIGGSGQMWRQLGSEEAIVDVRAGVSLTLPAGTHFQFRSDGNEPLVAVGVTMPPWLDENNESYPVAGVWEPTV